MVMILESVTKEKKTHSDRHTIVIYAHTHTQSVRENEATKYFSFSVGNRNRKHERKFIYDEILFYSLIFLFALSLGVALAFSQHNFELSKNRFAGCTIFQAAYVPQFVSIVRCYINRSGCAIHSKFTKFNFAKAYWQMTMTVDTENTQRRKRKKRRAEKTESAVGIAVAALQHPPTEYQFIWFSFLNCATPSSPPRHTNTTGPKKMK